MPLRFCALCGLLPTLLGLLMNGATILNAADPPAAPAAVPLDPAVRDQCLEILRTGLRSDQFWHAIHAAEGLTAAGHPDEVRAFCSEKLTTETDDQRRCGLARELVRAGDRRYADVLFSILSSENPHGHVHAAESLFKIRELGDGAALREAYARAKEPGLKVMAGAALARGGNLRVLNELRDYMHTDDLAESLSAWALGRVGDASDIPAIKEALSKRREPGMRAFYECALATLSDPDGRAAHRQALLGRSPHPALDRSYADARTMAAEFAPHVPHAAELIPDLTAMLDDPWPDARIRAAHALFAITQPAPVDRGDDVSNLVFAANDEHPRCSEGSVIELYDGSLLCAMTVFEASTSDFAKARILGRTSTDGGRTWGEPRVLQDNSGDMNVIGATLRRLKAPAAPGTIGLFYAQTNTFSDLRFYVRFSLDDGQTFGEPVLVTTNPGYHVVNNDRVTQLSTGRLVVPTASTADVEKENHFVCHCYVSDDGGRTWRDTPGRVDAPQRGAMEPEVIELNDGRLLMIARTQLGYIATSYSDDGGETWSIPGRFEGIQSPESPATIRRIPATGDLLLIWSNSYDAQADHGGARTPLNTAISTDEGRTWRNIKLLEPDLHRGYAYTSVLFVRNRFLLTYYDQSGDRYSARFRSLPVTWLYAE